MLIPIQPHPIRQRPLIHLNLTSNIRDRTARVDHPTHSLLFELRRILLPLHESSPLIRRLRPTVRKLRGTPPSTPHAPTNPSHPSTMSRDTSARDDSRHDTPATRVEAHEPRGARGEDPWRGASSYFGS